MTGETVEKPELVFDSYLREYPSDIKKFEKYLKLLCFQIQKSTDPEQKYKFLCEYGVLLRIHKNFDESLHVLNEVLAYAMQSGKKTGVIQNLVRLAHVYQWQGEFKAAEQSYAQIATLIEKWEISESLRATILQHQGKLYYDQNLYTKALSYFETALFLRKKLETTQEQIDSSELAYNNCFDKTSASITESYPEPTVLYAQEKYFESFHHAIDFVAKEKKYIEMIEAPSLQSVSSFQAKMIQNKMPVYYLVYKKDVVGWIDISAPKNERMQHRGGLGMGILPSFRAKGFGSQLMKAALEHAKKCNLEKIELQVYNTNLNALQLYKKFGFNQTGFISKFRKVDNKTFDAIQMELFL